MRRFVIFVLVSLTLGFCAGAQNFHSLLDTVMLQEVVTFGELRKYQSGAKIERISSKQIDLAQEGGIDNLLKRFSPIYIKSNAGGLATIHFRGTSASHTSINFGGINVNSLTLGHSNLSNIPSFLFDEISLQYGSSSAVNGSGSIGGALYLRLGNNWTNGVKGSLKTTVGSFGEYFTGTKIFTGNGKWESVTRVYFYGKENNFPFNNPYTGDVENPGVVRDIQKGASIKNSGLLQEINFRFSQNQYFKSSFWVENSWYEVQPNMQSNYRFNGTEEIDDDNIRIWADYTNNERKIHFKGGAGYVHDKQVYDNNDEQIIGTDRLVSGFQASIDFSSGLGFKAGGKYKYIKPNVYSYSDSVISYEQHFDIFLSSFYRIHRRLKFSMNLRQSFVTNFKTPFTPSLGAEYVLRTGSESFIKFTSAMARSFRVPTFNDRYWGTQGNPNLKPESGKNLELGAKYNFDNGKCQTTIATNLFFMDVKNWIEWRNFGVWQAQNVLEVVSRGFEFQANTSFPIGKMQGSLGLNYTFNPVEPVNTIEENGLLHRQMNYVPKQMGNASFGLKYKKWLFLTDGQFTGRRFTDDFGRELPANFIANCTVGHKISLQKHQLDFTFSLNNVFNADYQNEKYYAMPGRFFRFSIKYNFNNIK
ncbi:MAG: TonB-dependent receptor [Prolixibacteraceae bacterium]|nr:TonB-dependent receptor [Prolixibacteraceae bacterium]